eukprot:167197-Chlamydomonas_euryale.AAC.1
MHAPVARLIMNARSVVRIMELSCSPSAIHPSFEWGTAYVCLLMTQSDATLCLLRPPASLPGAATLDITAAHSEGRFYAAQERCALC